jgi:hypothetical protein
MERNSQKQPERARKKRYNETARKGQKNQIQRNCQKGQKNQIERIRLERTGNKLDRTKQLQRPRRNQTTTQYLPFLVVPGRFAVPPLQSPGRFRQFQPFRPIPLWPFQQAANPSLPGGSY